MFYSQIDEVNTETACQCPTTQGEGKVYIRPNKK